MAKSEPDEDRTRSFVALTSGTMVSHYQIINKIGSGGMGEVYLALDTKLNRKVALKFLPSHLCEDKDCRKRFTREAQAAAGLDHPNIAAIYEVGEYQGRPFYSMQVVQGQSLGEVIAGKDLPIERILEIAIQICEGLDAAHAKGITHRDIKPSNILLDEQGRVRIVDFGLASVRGSEQLTKTGSTLGTIGYMSPEQVQGKEVDHRSDLFSLGVVLYEMITKQNPFKKETEAATLKSVCDDIPEPLARYKSGLPEGLQLILDKALEKDAKTRYQNADDILADLTRIKRSLELGSSSVSVSLAGRHSSRFWLTAALLAVAAAVVVVLLLKPWAGAPSASNPGRIMLAVLPFENLGAAEDEYFADGVTDEVISKLAKVNGLGVISRTSSVNYKGTNKPLPEIAHELGVDFILEGTIRWDKSGPNGHVRVTPQLIKVDDDSHLWSDSYERALSGVFSVQTEIAENVATALGVILLDSDKPRLSAGGTTNIEAYLAFLRGLDLSRASPTTLVAQRTVEAYEKAISIDPNFAHAWSELSKMYAFIYHSWEKSELRREQALAAVNRSLAIDPQLADGHLALGYYYYWCLRDYRKALDEFAIAESLGPGEELNIEASAYIWRRQGKFKEAIERLNRVFQLNPRDAYLMVEIAASYLIVRNYPEVIHFADLALEVDPTMTWANRYLISATWAWKGDLSAARAYLERMEIGEDNFDYWFLQLLFERDYDGALRMLKSSGLESYDGGDVYWPTSFMLAEILTLEGRTNEARSTYSTAQSKLEAKIKEFPEDPRFYSALGRVLAGLGKNAEAVQEGLKAVEMCPVERDAFLGPAIREELAHIYLAVGDYDSALREYEYLLTVPTWISIKILQLDPRLDPVRDNPRYKALVEKYMRQDTTQ